MNNRKLPSLAGICTYEEAYRVGYSVDRNVELLKRYNYVKTRLVDIISKHMNRTPEWEVKGAFSLHIWLDAEHSQLIRKRVAEMREPPLQLDKVPTEELKAFLDEVLHTEDTLELLVGIYEVVRSNLLDAFKRHQA